MRQWKITTVATMAKLLLLKSGHANWNLGCMTFWGSLSGECTGSCYLLQCFLEMKPSKVFFLIELYWILLALNKSTKLKNWAYKLSNAKKNGNKLMGVILSASKIGGKSAVVVAGERLRGKGFGSIRLYICLNITASNNLFAVDWGHGMHFRAHATWVHRARKVWCKK